MSSSVPTSWVFDADYLQACNCDYGCPCEFAAPPTPGFCEGTGTWLIKTGRCWKISLSENWEEPRLKSWRPPSRPFNRPNLFRLNFTWMGVTAALASATRS